MRKIVMVSMAGAAIAAGILAPGASAGPGTTVIYDNTPNPVPPSVISQAYEAQQTREVGDQVSFAGTARELSSVKVIMNTWSCETGHWFSGNCASTAGDFATVPITLKLYNVNADGTSVDPAFKTVTQSFPMPYRPSADPICGDGRWHASDGCHNGMSVPITFDLTGTVVPDKLVYGISFATSTNGSNLVKSQDNCANDGGCYVDSLNIGVGVDAPSVGSRPGGDSAYLDADSVGAYCDGGSGGTGAFRYDAGSGCYFPMVQFNAVTPGPTCPAGATLYSGGTINGNLNVPANKSYCLSNERVTGDVTVQKNATLTMINGSSVGGNVKADKPASVVIDSSTVTHDVVASGATGPVSVTKSTIGHDLNLTKNKGDVTVSSNAIGHDLNVKDNDGTTTVTDNTIAHHQACGGNSSFTGSNNVGGGTSCNA